MKKIKNLLLVCIASLSFASCDTILQGMADGLGGYGGYGMGYMPTYGTGGGNMDYLLDPGYAAMQVAQQQAQMNTVNQQLISTSIRQVDEAEQAEYRAAKKYRPNLTLEQFRREKAEAYQHVNSSEAVQAHGLPVARLLRRSVIIAMVRDAKCSTPIHPCSA